MCSGNIQDTQDSFIPQETASYPKTASCPKCKLLSPSRHRSHGRGGNGLRKFKGLFKPSARVDPDLQPHPLTLRSGMHAVKSELIKCHDCGGSVSFRAASCPHCGSMEPAG